MRNKYRIGIDAGGTFTDFVFADENGSVELFKTNSTPEDGTKAIAAGLALIAESKGKSIREILPQTDLCINGTTVALNALIQFKGAKVGLLATAGHEDSLEIRLGHKEEGHRYDAKYPPAHNLVPRYLRVAIRERILADGSVRTPLDENDVRRACELFRRERVEAVAISFVWSVQNTDHENRAAEIVRSMLPEVFLTVGSEIFPQTREYTRTSTAVLNAYLGPVLKAYVGRVDGYLRELGATSPIQYFQSNGGMAPGSAMVSRAVYAINSGPASAPQAGLYFAQPQGHDNIITVDMGGTSFDITLTRGGKTNLNKNIDMLRYRVGVPMIQVETLGAGGGSIGWIDQKGLLNVGPQSAGADPGPACYGRGGREPTVTDANVVLGYLNPAHLLGGRVKLDREAAVEAIRTRIAEPLKLSVGEAAWGIHRIVNNNMVGGMRRVSIERGYDPRDFVLIAAGGAAALHITALARDIGIRTVLVPKLASGLCAFGQIISDVKHNFMAACPQRLDRQTDLEAIERLFKSLERNAVTALQDQGFAADEIAIERSMDMRYLGQVHECTVDIARMDVTPQNIADIRRRLDAVHRQLFTYDEPDSLAEVVNIESTVYGRVAKPAAARFPAGGSDASNALSGQREMLLFEDGKVRSRNVPVFDGGRMLAGNTIAGPAVIEEETTSILVETGWKAWLNNEGTFVLDQLD